MYRPFRDDDAAALARIHRISFSFPDDDAVRAWWQGNVGGTALLRVVEDAGGTVTGGLVDIPMGQFYGGRSVPMHGVAAVGVAPEARGRGTASALMAGYVEELHSKGIALSTLYASTRSLYRRAGYEVAGSSFDVRMPIATLSGGTRDLPVRPVTAEDHEAIAAIYTAHARHRSGWLDRRDYTWDRVRAFRGSPCDGLVVERDGAIDGYVWYRADRTGGFRAPIIVHDIGYASEAAARRLVGVLGALGPIAPAIHASGGVADAWLDLLPELRYELKLFEHWLLRIVSVEAAIAARGWPDGVAARVDLRVTDDLLPMNDGRFRIDIAGGRGTASRGGAGDARLDVRALATLYSGFASPWDLRCTGRLDADDRTCATLATLFAGPAPSMPDRF